MSVEIRNWTQEIKAPLTHEDLQRLASHEVREKHPDLSHKRLLSVAEFARYLGIGQTTARAILKNTRLGYRVKIKDTIMINKKKLDEFLDSKMPTFLKAEDGKVQDRIIMNQTLLLLSEERLQEFTAKEKEMEEAKKTAETQKTDSVKEENETEMGTEL